MPWYFYSHALEIKLPGLEIKLPGVEIKLEITSDNFVILTTILCVLLPFKFK